jgi:hypothetical protein
VCGAPAAANARSDTTLPAMSSTGRRPVVGRFVVQRVETVGMTDKQYEEAVNTLATLIVRWTTGHEQDSARCGQAELN